MPWFEACKGSEWIKKEDTRCGFTHGTMVTGTPLGMALKNKVPEAVAPAGCCKGAELQWQPPVA